jgi:hypothetical protein
MGGGSSIGPALGALSTCTPREMVHDSDQRPSGENTGVPRPGGLRSAGLRADQAEAHGGGGDRGGECAGGGGDLAVEAQLAERHPPIQHFRWQDAHGPHQGEGDGEIVVAALLRDVGGGEVDDQPFGREGEAEPGKGGPHPFAALAYRLVAETDDHEGDRARGQLNLHVHAARFNPLKGHGGHPRDHRPLLIYQK